MYSVCHQHVEMLLNTCCTLITNPSGLILKLLYVRDKFSCSDSAKFSQLVTKNGHCRWHDEHCIPVNWYRTPAVSSHCCCTSNVWGGEGFQCCFSTDANQQHSICDLWQWYWNSKCECCCHTYCSVICLLLRLPRQRLCDQVCLSFILSVILFVCRITAEVISWFQWNLVLWLDLAIGRTDWLLVVTLSQIRILNHCSTSLTIME